MSYIWKHLNPEYKGVLSDDFIVDGFIADEFIRQAGRLANRDMKPEYFGADWQHIIYRGLYCIAEGYPPPP